MKICQIGRQSAKLKAPAACQQISAYTRWTCSHSAIPFVVWQPEQDYPMPFGNRFLQTAQRWSQAKIAQGRGRHSCEWSRLNRWRWGLRGRRSRVLFQNMLTNSTECIPIIELENLPTVALYSAVCMPSNVLPVGEYIVPTAKNGISDVPWTSQKVPVPIWLKGCHFWVISTKSSYHTWRTEHKKMYFPESILQLRQISAPLPRKRYRPV